MSTDAQDAGNVDRLLIVVALVDRRHLVIPPGEVRLVLDESEVDAVSEEGEDVPNVRAILERCPHPGASPAAEFVDVAITEQRNPLLTLSDNGFAKFLLGNERSYQPAPVAPLLAHHLGPVSFVRHGLIIADDRGERR